MKLLNKTIWAITPEMLQTMMSIAEQTGKTPEAIAKEVGKDMKNTHKATVRDGVAIIPVTGLLFRYANLMTAICGATSYELLARDFNKALSDPNITSIVFDIDSPGGEVNGCSELADMIFCARDKKPILAYASGSCCSGAYWIASACDKILVNDTAILGSIGVVATYSVKNDKNVIEVVSSQSPNKRPDIETDSGKAKVQNRIDDLAEIFINKVSIYRNISPQTVLSSFGGGDVFVGKHSISNGLADGLSSLEDIISSFNKETIMTETLNIEEIKSLERQRMAEVFASDIAKGMEATAQALLSKTDLSATEILSVLNTIPKKTENAFDIAMANIKNPDIAPANDTAEADTPETLANRIAGYIYQGA